MRTIRYAFTLENGYMGEYVIGYQAGRAITLRMIQERTCARIEAGRRARGPAIPEPEGYEP